MTSGISGKRRRPVRCVVPKLLKMTEHEFAVMRALAEKWGLTASDTLKRALIEMATQEGLCAVALVPGKRRC